MIWLKSFGRAIETSLVFTLAGGFVSLAVNSLLAAAIVVPIVLIAFFLGNLQSNRWLNIIVEISFLIVFMGSFLSGVVMGLYGFLCGWRPHPPDIYRVLYIVLFSSWLCLFTGVSTGFIALFVWQVVSGTSALALVDNPVSFLCLVGCYFVGAIIGAVAPDYVERSMDIGSHSRHWKNWRKARQYNHNNEEL